MIKRPPETTQTLLLKMLVTFFEVSGTVKTVLNTIAIRRGIASQPCRLHISALPLVRNQGYKLFTSVGMFRLGLGPLLP
jgi:hypothetical protein